jgi:DNA-directed RNA polymerase subunit RPC12/RpoP
MMRVRCPKCKYVNSVDKGVIDFHCSSCSSLLTTLKNKEKIRCPKCKKINYADKGIEDLCCDHCFAAITIRKECKCLFRDGHCIKCNRECECDYINTKCIICGKLCNCTFVKGICTTCGKDKYEGYPDKGYYTCPRCQSTDFFIGNVETRTKGPTLIREFTDSGVYGAINLGNETKIVRRVKCKECGELITKDNYTPSAQELRNLEGKNNTVFFKITIYLLLITAIGVMFFVIFG